MRNLKNAVLLAGLLICSQTAHCRFANVTQPVPIERLVENVSRYITEHPQDAEGYYTLGRIHSLAFAQRTKDKTTVEVIPAGSKVNEGAPGLPGFAGYQSVQVKRPNDEPLSDEALAHLKNSVRYYAKATQLAPKNALYLLGYGWMLEQGVPYAAKAGAAWDEKTDTEKKPLEIKADDWISRSKEAYRKAFDLTIESDRQKTKGPGADSIISEEAGEGLFRLFGVKPKPSEADKAKTEEEMLEINRLRAALSKTIRRPYAVTPIILPLGPETNLQALLSPHKTTKFDLTGDNFGRKWPWVSTNTGILVWDPERTGKITSGRQLFGSVTWWIFWKDGYQALASLDDNSDGFLRGDELKGLSIWRDANGNGVSEPGEVRPLIYWKITCLATKATMNAHGMPANRQGFERNGTWLPTYDWTPRSLN